MDRIVREKNKAYQEVYQKALRANPTPEYKVREKEHNEKQKVTTLERQDLEIHRFWNGSQPRCLSSRSPTTPKKIPTILSTLGSGTHNASPSSQSPKWPPDSALRRCCHLKKTDIK
ncbi:hypothetical protein QBC37DRAFT_399069 [Rhypophila decipiens]|uniref:Uncharacterized protein n=1 Tax=Rhypophila decipiens TaxID=261697 RepID=A0AAN6YA53_9PEZI|nr:hypothetical protein QBC37DRAFT_399069 [Rhypophila decipiens]